MAHQVKCVYCESKFDRDKYAFVAVRTNRYAHASCYLRARELDTSIPELEVIDPNDTVTCCYCKKEFNKKKIDYVQISNNKYAHKECAELEEKREKTDEEKLEAYIMLLFDWTFIPPRVKKQITSFIQEYDYSYSGIQKSLKYFFEVKGNSIEKANGGIGIVPYVYRDAYNYYYALWEAQQRNQYKVIDEYVPQIKEIKIPAPVRLERRKSAFSFLDEESEE